MMSDRIIVALDLPDGEAAMDLVGSLGDAASRFKVGLTLFASEGPALVEQMTGLGKRVFLDLKLHDIPHQVEGAVREMAGLGVEMLTVHATGGEAMMRAAVSAADEAAREEGTRRPAVLAVTVLTSLGADDLSACGVAFSAEEQVRRLARLAAAAGVDGVVCSPLEARAVRDVIGPDALVVTPGVRLAGPADDQRRVATPAAALAAGASHLVIGRPIASALDPREAFELIAAQLCEGEDEA